MPGPIEGNLLLVTKPKGIYKPADLPYALSIRINLGRYIDGMPLPTPGGGWLLPPGEQPSDLPSVADDQ
jgi:putative restriction endonuclease